MNKEAEQWQSFSTTDKEAREMMPHRTTKTTHQEEFGLALKVKHCDQELV